MPLTRDFDELVIDRMQSDREFCKLYIEKSKRYMWALMDCSNHPELAKQLAGEALQDKPIKSEGQNASEREAEVIKDKGLLHISAPSPNIKDIDVTVYGVKEASEREDNLTKTPPNLSEFKTSDENKPEVDGENGD